MNWKRLWCRLTGRHAPRPLSLPGGNRVIFSGPCWRCGQ